MLLFLYVKIMPFICVFFSILFAILCTRNILKKLTLLTLFISLLLTCLHGLLAADIDMYSLLHVTNMACAIWLLSFSIISFMNKAKTTGILSLLFSSLVLFNSFSWVALMSI